MKNKPGSTDPPGSGERDRSQSASAAATTDSNPVASATGKTKSLAAKAAKALESTPKHQETSNARDVDSKESARRGTKRFSETSEDLANEGNLVLTTVAEDSEESQSKKVKTSRRAEAEKSAELQSRFFTAMLERLENNQAATQAILSEKLNFFMTSFNSFKAALSAAPVKQIDVFTSAANELKDTMRELSLPSRLGTPSSPASESSVLPSGLASALAQTATSGHPSESTHTSPGFMSRTGDTSTPPAGDLVVKRQALYTQHVKGMGLK